MFYRECFTGNVILHDYDELNGVLVASCVLSTASECHGILCALVCGNGFVREQDIRDYLLDKDVIMHEDKCLKYLFSLAEDIAATMRHDDCGLRLFLMDDGCMSDRCRSLAEWCQGFISGIGLSGIAEQQLSSESRELIDDFYSITNLDVDSEIDDDNDNDAALTELVEYVRIGMLFIFEDLQGSSFLPQAAH